LAKSRTQTVLAVIVVGIGAIVAAILGLFAYVSATATPIHPDPQKAPSATQAAPSPTWAEAVEQGRLAARAGLGEQNLPGLSVAVGVDGDLVWAEAFGWADLEKQTGITPKTRLRVTNASNTLTSAAVGLLLEKHALNLDDEIQKYVPDYPKKQWPLTLRQVMGDMGGVTNDDGDEESLAHCESTLEGIQRFAKTPLRFEPGTASRSSSYGWILVSAAVEAAAYEAFFKFMRGQIFEPLGMTATLPDSALETIPDRATFYFPRFGGDTRYGPELAREGDQSCFAGAGGFLSTPSDLVRFGMAMSGGKLLQPDTVKTLQTPQTLKSGEQTAYGLGWALETIPLAGEPARMAGHGSKSDFIGGSTYLMTFPERQIVVAVMTNTSFADAKSIALKIAEPFAEQQKKRPTRK
jgi:serine beta-lactamase-like protein LACTB, mitochondrial